MKFTTAITRKPGANFAQGLTSVIAGNPQYAKIISQHKAYVGALRAAGLQTIVLEPLEAYPDAYFVEDVAIVTRKKAVIARPGAPSRRGETDHITTTLARFRDLAWIEAPGTLDGGDVLMFENQCLIGISLRTNEAGAEQLGSFLEEEGIAWAAVPVEGGLHLKSDVNYIGRDTLLMTPKMAGLDQFKSYKKIVVDEDEAYAANSLMINGRLLIPKGFPKIQSKLMDEGFDLVQLDTSEIRKMDGGLTCLSLRL